METTSRDQVYIAKLLQTLIASTSLYDQSFSLHSLSGEPKNLQEKEQDGDAHHLVVQPAMVTR